MISLRSRLFMVVIALSVISIAVVSCKEKAAEDNDNTTVQPVDTVDTSQMDSASTRPVKTTN